MAERVELIEVGLRDGLQREPVIVPLEEKLRLIEGLIAAGVRRLQVTSFVHPRLVPQMADAEALCARLPRVPGVEYSGLALNLKGVERAAAAGLELVDISLSASEPHSRRNANRGIDAARAEIERMATTARAHGMRVRGGIQCVFGYQDPGDVAAGQVAALAEHLLERVGVDELSLADSSGLADPRGIGRMLETILPRAGDVPLVLHLHDTRGMGLANVVASLDHGVRRFDTALGGLGGCPFIDGATGNIATEDTAYLLHRLGYATGIDLAALAPLTRDLGARLGHDELPGKLYRLVPGGERARESAS